MHGFRVSVSLILIAPLAHSAFAADSPDEAMMRPIRILAHFMESPPASHVPSVFASSDVVIIENFAPYIFAGPNTVVHWEAGFRQHFDEGKLSGLVVKFREPLDFSRDGDRASFTLPAVWNGKSGQQRFTETGAWSFVLLRAGGEWRVLAYTWGVIDFHYVAEPIR